MARRKARKKDAGRASRPFPVRIGGTHRWEYVASESWREHGGKPAAFLRAVVEREIDRRMGQQAAAFAPVLPAGLDPHAAVRKAMLALPGLVSSMDALASAGCRRPEDLARLASAAEAIAAGVRGYVRHSFSPPSDPGPDLEGDLDGDEP